MTPTDVKSKVYASSDGARVLEVSLRLVREPHEPSALSYTALLPKLRLVATRSDRSEFVYLVTAGAALDSDSLDVQGYARLPQGSSGQFEVVLESWADASTVDVIDVP